jgi:hypothetical protein
VYGALNLMVKMKREIGVGILGILLEVGAFCYLVDLLYIFFSIIYVPLIKIK